MDPSNAPAALGDSIYVCTHPSVDAVLEEMFCRMPDALDEAPPTPSQPLKKMQAQPGEELSSLRSGGTISEPIAEDCGVRNYVTNQIQFECQH